MGVHSSTSALTETLSAALHTTACRGRRSGNVRAYNACTCTCSPRAPLCIRNVTRPSLTHTTILPQCTAEELDGNALEGVSYLTPTEAAQVLDQFRAADPRTVRNKGAGDAKTTTVLPRRHGHRGSAVRQSYRRSQRAPSSMHAAQGSHGRYIQCSNVELHARCCSNTDSKRFEAAHICGSLCC